MSKFDDIAAKMQTMLDEEAKELALLDDLEVLTAWWDNTESGNESILALVRPEILTRGMWDEMKSVARPRRSP